MIVLGDFGHPRFGVRRLFNRLLLVFLPVVLFVALVPQVAVATELDHEASQPEATQRQAVRPGEVPDGLTPAEWRDIEAQIADLQAADGAPLLASDPELRIVNAPMAPTSPLAAAIVPGVSATSVAEGGEFIAVGAPSANTVFVIRRAADGSPSNDPGDVQTIVGAANSEFGASVALGGSFLAIGAPGANAEAGEVELWRVGPDGVFVADAANPLVGLDVGPGDRFGEAVALSQAQLAVGAPFDDGPADGTVDQGAVYSWDLPNRNVETALRPGAAGDQVGAAIAASRVSTNGRLWVGNPINGGGPGAVYIYDETNTLQETLSAPAPIAGDRFGAAVGADGGFGVVGSPGGNGGAGTAYAFSLGTTNDVQELVVDSAVVGDEFGAHVAVAGDRFAVAAANSAAVVVFSDNGLGITNSSLGSPVPELSTASPAQSTGVALTPGGVLITQNAAVPGPGESVTYVTSGATPATKLVANRSTEGDALGNAIAIDGDTLVAGAAAADDLAGNSGRAIVFKRSGDGWVEDQLLYQPGLLGTGSSVAIDGNVVVLGGQDGVTVYTRPSEGADFSLEGIVTDPDGAADGQGFAQAVATDGSTLLVGDSTDTEATAGGGALYVFTGGPSQWLSGPPAQKLFSATALPDGAFGIAVAFDENRIVVGQPSNEAAATPGSAYIFTRPDAVSPFDPAPSATLTGSLAPPAQQDGFGRTVAIDGDRAVVGAFATSAGGLNLSGAAYVFTFNGGGWDDGISLAPAALAGGDRLGFSVDIVGDAIAIGAPISSGAAAQQGEVHLFANTSGSWTEADTFTAADAEAFDQLGRAVAIDDGNGLITGASGEDQGGDRAGALYLFDVNISGPNPDGLVTLADAATSGDEFGYAVDIELNEFGTTGRKWLAVGAPGANGTGEVYLFQRLVGDDGWSLIETFAPNDGVAGDRFGSSVAVAGNESTTTANLLFVGAPGHNGTGATYVYRRANNTEPWLLFDKLSGEVAGDAFGASLDFDADGLFGGHLLIGAPSPAADGRRGRFSLHSVQATQILDIVTVPQRGALDSEGDEDAFASSVSIDRGELFAIGAPGDDGDGDALPDGGSVHVYQAQLDYPGELYVGAVAPQFIFRVGADNLELAAGARLGTSVSTEPDRIAAGAPGISSVLVLEPGASASAFWGLADTITDIGSPEFGAAVDLEDGTVLIGATGLSGAKVASYDGTDWTLDGGVQIPSPGQTGDGAGRAVALADDGTTAVGAPTADVSAAPDAGGVWFADVAVAPIVDNKIVATGENASSDVQVFGGELDTDGQRAIVGAWYTSTSTRDRVGTAYVLENQGGQWVVAAELPRPTSLGGNNSPYGRGVSIDGTTAMVTDPGNGLHIWEEVAGVWTYQELIVPPAQPDLGGASGLAGVLGIKIDGDTALLGDFSTTRLTYAHVLERTPGGDWEFVQALGPSDRSAANPLIDTRFGLDIAIDGDWIAVTAQVDDETAPEAGAAYLYRRDGGGQWEFAQKVTALSSLGDHFGEGGVSIDGDTMIVGSRLEDGPTIGNTGGAWILRLDPATGLWRDTVPDSGDPFDPFDPVLLQPQVSSTEQFAVVDLDGDVAVIASQAARADGITAPEAMLYNRTAQGRWVQSGRYAPPDREAEDQRGVRTKLVDGQVLMTSNRDANNNGVLAGAVYVFEAPDDPDEKLLGPTVDAVGQMGREVAADEDWLLVGATRVTARGSGTRDPGEVFVFRLGPESGTYEYVETLRAENPEFGDRFGQRLAIDGDRLAVGAADTVTVFRFNGTSWTFGETLTVRAASDLAMADTTLAVGRESATSGPLNAGQVEIYTENPAGTFVFDETLEEQVPTEFARFGSSLDITGFRMVVGTPGTGGDDGPGRAFIFQRSGDTWNQIAELNPDNAEELVGTDVAVEANLVVLSSPSEGAAYVFEAPTGGGPWRQIDKIVNANANRGDRFGSSVDILGGRIIIGDDRGEGATSRSGAVHIFERSGPTSWEAGPVLAAPDGADNDFFGWAMTATAGNVVVGAYGADTGFGQDQGAAYVFPLDGGTTVPNKIIASDGDDLAGLGATFSDIDGDWAVVGALGAEPGFSGKAYVLRRDGDGWVEHQILTSQAPSSPDADRYGYATAIDGDVVAVGTRAEGVLGYVEIYRRNTTTDEFEYVNTITSPSQTPGDRFGLDIDLEGDRIAVGNFPSEPDEGSAYVFTTSDGWQTFSEQEVPLPPTGAAQFGEGVELIGDNLFVADKETDRGLNDVGEVHRYRLTNDTWGFDETIISTEPTADGFFGRDMTVDGDLLFVGTAGWSVSTGRPLTPGRVEVFRFDDQGIEFVQLIEAPQPERQFGTSLAAQSGRLIVGSGADSGGLLNSGAAHVYEQQAGQYELTTELAAADASAGDFFGSSVALDGDQVLVGAGSDDNQNGVRAGAVYYFQLNDLVANKLFAADGETGDNFSVGMAIEGDVLVVGAPGSDDGTGRTVYVFERDTTGAWQPAQSLEPTDTDPPEQFGASVEINNGTILVGDPRLGSGQSGSVYVFTPTGANGDWEQVDELDPSGSGGGFGSDLAVVGNTLVVAASEDLQVFTGSGATWTGPELVPLPDNGSNSIARRIDFDGTSIVTLGTDAVARVYVNNGQEWGLQDTLEPVDATQSPFAGVRNVAIDGDVALVADQSAASAGTIAVFQRTPGATTWAQDQTLTAPTGGPLQGFGTALVVDGSRLFIGAPAAAASGDVGYVVPYRFDGTEWVADEPILGQARELFGFEIAVGGATLVVGAPSSDGASPGTGAAYVFEAAGPDDPVLDSFEFETSGPPTAEVGAAQIAISDLAPIQQSYRVDEDGTILASPLGATDLNPNNSQAANLSDVSLADLNLDGLDIAGDPLDSVLLSEIPIDHNGDGLEDGWGAVLAGTNFADVPIQNVSLADLYELDAAGLLPAGFTLDQLDLAEVNLAATPLRTVPVAAVALAGVPLRTVDFSPGGDDPLVDWCNLLSDLGFDCAADFGLDLANPASEANNGFTLAALTLAGVPLRTVPLRTVPLRTVDLSVTPLRTVPLSAIELEASPLRTVPLRTVDIGATPLRTVPLRTVPLRTVPLRTVVLLASPLRTVPLRTVDLQASPLRTVPLRTVDLTVTPLRTVPLRTVPLRTVPLRTVPLTAIEIGAITIGATPLRTVPLRTVDIDATPLRTVPLRTVRMETAPLRTVPLRTVPLRTVPLRTVDLDLFTLQFEGEPTATPLRTVPLRTVDLAATPIGSTPLRTVPLSQILNVVDCTLVNCFSDLITLGDASDAGAIRPDAVLGDLANFADAAEIDGFTDLLGTFHLSELADAVTGVVGSAEEQLQAQLDASTDTLETVENDAERGFGDLTLGDLPRDSSQFGDTTLGDLNDEGLGQIHLGDLADGILNLSEQDLQEQLDQITYDLGAVFDREDLSFGDLALGDLPASEQLNETTLGDIEGGLDDFSVKDLNDHLDAEGQTDLQDEINLLEVEDLIDVGDGWGETSLGDIIDETNPEVLALLNATTIEALVNAIAAVDPAVLDVLTLGDLLFAILGSNEYPWEAIDFEAAALESLVGAGDIDYEATFEVAGTTRNKTVEVRVELPLGSTYTPDTGVVDDGSGTPIPLEPSGAGETLVWSVPVRAGTTYRLRFSTKVSLRTGSADTVAAAAIAGGFGETLNGTSISVVEQQDPGGDVAGALAMAEDTIYLQYINPPGDVDLYSFEVANDGDRLSVVLSNLPDDYDLVLYGPQQSILPPSPHPDSTDPIVDDPGIDVGPGDDPVDTELAGDIPTSLGGRPIVGRSTLRGTSDERIDTLPLRAGTHYIQVTGYNGAASPLPYGLRLKSIAGPAVPECMPPAEQGTGTVGTTNVPSDANALFVVNQQRLGDLYGQEAADAAVTEINNLIGSPQAAAAGITGGVVAVESNPAVAELYNAWTGEGYCDVDAANAVVGAVVDAINAASNGRDIEYVVLVGGDDVIPFARVPDGTTIANEQSYSSTFPGINNALVASMAGGYLLTDEPYGDEDPRGFDEARTFYLGDRALGRLVETPSEITATLSNFRNFDGALDPTTGFVAAYDFLDDGGLAVAEALDNDVAITDATTLINDVWDRVAFNAGLATAIDSGPTIGSLNAHFDHYRALPASENSVTVPADLIELSDLPADLSGSVLFSMGCHAGFSVSDVLVGLSPGVRADWSQTISDRGGLFVGNTGYGYGDTEAVLYSEQVMSLYAARLDGSVTVGEALLFAKQEYAADLAQIGVYDAKSLMGATFYGLPFFGLNVAGTPEPPPVLNPPDLDPDPVTGQETSTIVVTPSDTRVVPADVDNGTLYAQQPEGTDEELVQGTHYRPIQPRLETDISQVDTADPTELDVTAHGVLVTELTTIDIDDVDPVISRPIYDLSANEPEPSFAETVFPAEPTEINTYLTPEGERQQLVIVTGQFRSDDDTNVQRLYNELETTIYYADDTQTDFVPPVFKTVEATVSGSQLTIQADVADGEGTVERVFVLIADDPAGCDDLTGESCPETVWQPLDLRLNAAGIWSGSTSVSGDSGQVEYLVQAVDNSGNVAVTSNKARNYEATPNPVPPPDPEEFDIVVSPNVPPEQWFDGEVTVSVNASSPDATFTYVIEELGDPPQPVPADGFLIQGEGIFTILVTADDGQVEQRVVRLDRSPPEAQIGSPSTGDIYLQGSDASVNVVCRDTWSEVTCEATIDGQAVSDGDTFTNLAAGEHTLRVTATDEVGKTAVAESTFEITDIPMPTITALAVTPDVITTDDTVTLTAEVTGPAGSSLAISWGDGSQCQTGDEECELTDQTSGEPGRITGTHQFTEAGGYLIEVTVTDVFGRSVTDEIEIVVLPACVVGDELIVNGSFENHDVPPGEWAIFESIEGWTTTFGPGIEIQNFDQAADGTTHVELDSTANSGMRQEIPTIPGNRYLVSWSYRPAPGTNILTNGIAVRWDGAFLDLKAGRGRRNSPWVTESYVVTATGTTTNLDFSALGFSSGAGGLVDAVSVSCTENLVTNGSFENHDVPPGEWAIFESIEGWTTTFGPGIEIQNFDQAADGTTHVELDSTANSGMQQEIPTIPGNRYRLQIAYRPRPGTGPGTNGIAVYWNGRRVINRRGFLSPWRVFEVEVVGGPDGLDQLEIRARGRSSGFGGLVDDVGVYPID